MSGNRARTKSLEAALTSPSTALILSERRTRRGADTTWMPGGEVGCAVEFLPCLSLGRFGSEICLRRWMRGTSSLRRAQRTFPMLSGGGQTQVSNTYDEEPG